MKQKEIEDMMNQTQQPQWLVNNIFFCYEGETYTRNDNEKNNTSYNKITKSKGNKSRLCSNFLDIIRKETLPDEASIHIIEMTAIKTALREIRKRENQRWVI